jgi:alpha-N-arabinofuranosidase
MACQFNTAEIVPLDQLDPYIQDALDLIEFANGSESSEWGSIRAKMGHPAPFNMKYLGIGNEQWGPQYFERYALFEKAVKEKYPEINLISSTGPQPDGDLFDFAVEALKSVNADIVDEHYYRPPSWFRENAKRYDTYDRNGYKIFAGEYAAQSVYTTSPLNKNNWECALAEAAFMTGLERNADVVVMSSYAPLFAHHEGWQWTPDLIWFDNLNAYGTANYYVQQLFATNRGTHVLNMRKNNQPITGQNDLFASAALDQQTGEVILKLVNTSDKMQNPAIVLSTKRKVHPKSSITMLQHNDTDAMNSPENMKAVVPVTRDMSVKGKKISPELPAYSLMVIRIKFQ